MVSFSNMNHSTSKLNRLAEGPRKIERRLETQENQMLKEVRGLMGGLPEVAFWQNFVKCVVCDDIVCRQGMFAVHRCLEAIPPRWPRLSPQPRRPLPYDLPTGIRRPQFRISKANGQVQAIRVRTGPEDPWYKVDVDCSRPVLRREH